MLKRIPNKVRKEAALIAAIWASTPQGWFTEAWSDEARELYTDSFVAVSKYDAERGYQYPYDEDAHETAAEVALLLEEGWSPYA